MVLSRILALVFSLLLVIVGTSAKAETTWFGAQLGFPIPGDDLGNDQLGVDAGLTFSHMKSPFIGIGVDVAYHYWPASASYKAAFDQFLRQTRYQVLDGTSWAFDALQTTFHLRLAAPLMERHEAWMKIGGGVYRVDYNTQPPSWEGTSVRVIGPMHDVETVFGASASVGFDVRSTPGIALGLDGTYHYLSEEVLFGGQSTMPSFSTFTVGLHLVFGRTN